MPKLPRIEAITNHYTCQRSAKNLETMGACIRKLRLSASEERRFYTYMVGALATSSHTEDIFAAIETASLLIDSDRNPPHRPDYKMMAANDEASKC